MQYVNGTTIVFVYNNVLCNINETSRKVSGVCGFSAVSARPFRAPFVEIKNSITDKPSLKFARIGSSIISPLGFAIRPRIPESCRIWFYYLVLRNSHHIDAIETFLVFSSVFIITEVSSSFAFCQTSITQLYRSSCVITPLWYCCIMETTSLFAFSIIPFFFRDNNIIHRNRRAKRKLRIYNQYL